MEGEKEREGVKGRRKRERKMEGAREGTEKGKRGYMLTTPLVLRAGALQNKCTHTCYSIIVSKLIMRVNENQIKSNVICHIHMVSR